LITKFIITVFSTIIYELLSDSNQIISASDFFPVYPWTKGYNSFERRADLLNILKSQPIKIKLLDSIIPDIIFSSNNSNSVKDINNIIYEIKLFNEETTIQNKSNELILNRDEQIQIIMDGLQNICLILNTETYWMYEWCHRKDIRQFHILHPPNGNDKPIRSPDWSLGSYESSLVVREDGTQSADYNSYSKSPISKIIDFYIDGQHCDETGSGRRSQVHTQCCPNDDNNSNSKTKKRKRKDKHSQTISNQHKIEIKSIREYDTCLYELVVCAEFLCNINSNQSIIIANDLKVKNKIEMNLTSYMTHMNTTCMYRQEDWWTYELCFNSGIKQFHSEIKPIKQEDGTLIQTQVVVSQFDLGFAPLNIYSDIGLLEKLTSYGHTKNVTSSNNLNYLVKFGMPPPNLTGIC